MYQSLYQEFLSANPYLIHMAAHSHHYWPDVVKDAILASYEDSRKLADLKWDKILGEVVPTSQSLIAKILNLSHPEQIAFASNTHELLARLLSCFDPCAKLSILTTDSEFHSANRQIKRLEELENVRVTRIEANSADFEERFLKAIQSGGHDFIFLSQVFFNTGKAISVETIDKFVQAKDDKTIFCLDGYHGFCAIPTELSRLEDKIFYLAGSYKYAQAGEGMCFMTIPKECKLRPLNTGWFASFATLEKEQDTVAYAEDGWRFAGSTRDFSAHYRFNFVWEQFFKMGIDVPMIHNAIQELQSEFLEGNTHADRFTNIDLSTQGHFLSLKTGSAEISGKLHDELRRDSILTDYRGEYLRFGFGLYLSSEQVRKVKAHMSTEGFSNFF